MVALLLQIRDKGIQTIMPQARVFSMAHEHGDEHHYAMWHQLRAAVVAMDTGLDQVVAIHQRLVQDVLRHAEQAQQRFMALGIVFLHLGVFTLLGGHLLLYRIIVDPLQRLNAAMQRVAQGDVQERLSLQGTRECRELATSFNIMTAQLEADATIRRTFAQELEARVTERTRELQDANEKLQQTQRRLFEAERIATIGEMAASVTHEIRQPLNALSINFQMIKRGLRGVLPTLDANVIEHVRLLENEITRINDVIAVFMKSAHASPRQPQPLDLTASIRDVVQLLAAEATAAQVTVSYQNGAALPPLMADASQLRQVLINLLRNAIQAQPDGGTVRSPPAMSSTPHRSTCWCRIVVQELRQKC